MRTRADSASRYVALLRGVSPMNLKMADLKRSLERAGFKNVKTLLSSGNAAFDAPAKSNDAIAVAVEKALLKIPGRAFPVIVRSSAEFQSLLDSDPFSKFELPANAKRIVTFLKAAPDKKVKLPPEQDGARILAVRGLEVLSAYTPSPKGPVFMALIEKTFGKNVTTRTWDTVRKCAAA